MINKRDISGPEIVTGSQHCKSSTLYFPHCAELNTNYTDVVSRNLFLLTNLAAVLVGVCMQIKMVHAKTS